MRSNLSEYGLPRYVTVFRWGRGAGQRRGSGMFYPAVPHLLLRPRLLPGRWWTWRPTAASWSAPQARRPLPCPPHGEEIPATAARGVSG